MAQQTKSVVTPERFESGVTWAEYSQNIKRNRDKFQLNYDETQLSDADTQTFRELVAKENGPAKVLALGEDWCPDVVRGLPVMARIAEASGMELRIFPRDDNLDIMQEFLNEGKYESIPTFVFYTRDHELIAFWSERPAKANAELHQLRSLVDGKDREEARALYSEFQRGPVWASWRVATIDELRDLLQEKCG
jgi:hypothetical protein